MKNIALCFHGLSNSKSDKGFLTEYKESLIEHVNKEWDNLLKWWFSD